MLPIEPYESQSWPQDAEGKFDVNKVIKRDQQRGNRDNKPLYLTPTSGGEMPRTSLPYKYAGQVAPHEGYKQRALFLMHNVITPEGQAWIRENAGYFKTGFARVVHLTQEQLTEAGIEAGATFSGGDQLKMLGRILGRGLQSYEHAAIDKVEKQEDGGYLIEGGGFKGLSGASFKLMQKAAAAVTPYTSGIIPKGHHMVMAMSGAGDLMGIGERALGVRYNDTNDFMRVMQSYAIGYNKLTDDEKQWVDKNADWIKTAEHAGRYSRNQTTVKNLPGQQGVIGDLNAPIFSTMIRDYALSQVAVHELHNQIIDASTYEMHKDAEVDGRPMLENMQLLSGSGDSAIYKVGTYRDYGISAEVINQIQPEFERSTATISGETLDKMARYNPGMFAYLNELEDLGVIRNPSRDIATAVRANYKDETGREARGALNFDNIRAEDAQRSIVSIANVTDNFDEMYAAIREAMPNASDGVIDEEFLKQAAEKLGNHALQVGNIILPSVQAALSTFTLDPDQDAVSSLGSKMVNVLVAHTNMRNAVNVGEMGAAEEFANQRFAMAYEALQTAQAMTVSGEKGRPEEMIKKVGGMTLPVIAGSAIGSKLLKPNEISVSMEKLFEMTHAKTEGERKQVLEFARSGQLTAMVQMFPEANSKAMSIQARVRLNEDINAEYGDPKWRDFLLSNENAMHMSEQIAFALTKDFDRDSMRTILSGMFVGQGDDRHWIGADVMADSESKVRRIAEASVGAETVKQQERAAQTLAEYTQEVWDKYKPQSAAEIGKSYEDFLRAKFEMGPAYNFGIRGITRFTEILMDRAGIKPSRFAGTNDPNQANVDRLQTAISGFSQYAYQTAIDFNVNSDPAVQRIQGMFKSLNWDSKKTGNPLSFYVDPVTNKAISIPESKFKTGLAAEVMKTYASIGLHTTGLEDLSAEDRAAELKARAEDYKQYMAPHLAVMMMPLNANETQRSAALEYLTKVADIFAETGKFEFVPRQFATIAGKINELDWFVGNPKSKLEDTVPAAAAIAARAGLRVDEKNPGKSGTKMGNMPVYEDILKQVDAFLDAHKSESVEEFLTRVPLQAPEVTPYTQKAMRRTGGSGREEITQLRALRKDEIPRSEIVDQTIAPMDYYQEQGIFSPGEEYMPYTIERHKNPAQPTATPSQIASPQAIQQAQVVASQIITPQNAQVATPNSLKKAEQDAKRDELHRVMTEHPEYSVKQLAQAIERSPSWVRAWKKQPPPSASQTPGQGAPVVAAPVIAAPPQTAPPQIIQQAQTAASQIVQAAASVQTAVPPQTAQQAFAALEADDDIEEPEHFRDHLNEQNKIPILPIPDASRSDAYFISLITVGAS